SLLDGACKVEGLAARAAEFGQPAIALTDHGVMNGAVELHQACAKHGVKPIIGCEIYLVEDHAVAGAARSERNHLTLLAADDADDLLRIFGRENVYFEVQKNGLAPQEKCNEHIVRIAREVGGSLVGTGDVHYLRREDYDHHRALLCVQTKSTIAAPKLTFETNEVYLRDSAQKAAAVDEWTRAG